MVSRRCTQLRCELRAARRLQLVGVQLQLQSASARRFQDRPGLVKSEHSGLAEHIRECRQFLPRNGRQLFRDQLLDVSTPSVRTAAIILRDFVCAKPRRHEPKVCLALHTCNDTQRLELVFA